MRTVRHQRGYAMVMAMLLLAIGAIMTAWVYSMLRTATAVARNNTAQSRAMMAAESGLAYVTAQIKRVTNDAANPITATSEAEALHNVALALEARWSVTGSELEVSDSASAPYMYTNGTASLSDNCSFGFDLRPNNRDDSDYTLTITGRYGDASRVIGLHLSKGVPDMPGWMHYPMISRRDMTTNQGAANAYRWDPSTRTADRNDPGRPTEVSDGWALKFNDTPDPEDPTFPSKYPSSELYAKLEAMRTGQNAVLSTFAVPKDSNGNDLPVSSLQNVFIPAGAANDENNEPRNVVLADNATINGIVYVEWPTSLTMGNNVTINGIIVYTKPSAEALEEQADKPEKKWPAIYVDRMVTMASDPAQVNASVLAAFQSAGGSASEAQRYENMLWPWTVLAPDTNWMMENGNTQGDFQFTGNIHVRNFGKASGSGNMNPDDYCFHGVIMCEGTVGMTGNRRLALDPPDPDDSHNHLPNGVALDVAHGGYWEQ